MLNSVGLSQGYVGFSGLSGLKALKLWQLTAALDDLLFDCAIARKAENSRRAWPTVPSLRFCFSRENEKPDAEAVSA